MFRRYVQRSTAYIQRHHTVLTAGFGSGIVTLWTVLRHFTNGINFDVVGQVGISAQWLHGLHAGALIGPTNYILKMPLYTLVNLMTWIDPKLRLLILALICNLGTFLLLYWLIRKITGLYTTRTAWLADVGVLWLAAIAGRVFWTDYANSRNLEVAGGIAVLYLCLKLWQIPSRRDTLALAGIAVATFFADPLQRYTIGVGLVALSAVAALRFRNANPQRYVITGVVLLAAVLGSVLLAKLVPHILPLGFLDSPRAAQTLTLHTLPTTIAQVGRATLHLFDADVLSAPLGLSSIRQLAAIGLFCMAAHTIGRGMWRVNTRLPHIVIGGLIVLTYAVYIISGYTYNAHSERYLVLVPILVIILLALQSDMSPRRPGTTSIWLGFVIISGFLLTGGVLRAIPTRYTHDAPMLATAAFAKQHSYQLVLTSRQLAIPANYYASYARTIVPLVCTASGQLVTSNVFYDKAGYDDSLGAGNGTVALIVPLGGVFSDPFYCSQSAILRQFGQPTATYPLQGVGTVFEYPASAGSIKQLRQTN